MAKKAIAKKKPTPIEIEIEDEPASERQYGALPSKAKVCAFCKHPYVNPCSDKTKDKCPNYQYLQSRGKGKGK